MNNMVLLGFSNSMDCRKTKKGLRLEAMRQLRDWPRWAMIRTQTKTAIAGVQKRRQRDSVLLGGVARQQRGET